MRGVRLRAVAVPHKPFERVCRRTSLFDVFVSRRRTHAFAVATCARGTRGAHGDGRDTNHAFTIGTIVRHVPDVRSWHTQQQHALTIFAYSKALHMALHEALTQLAFSPYRLQVTVTRVFWCYRINPYIEYT